MAIPPLQTTAKDALNACALSPTGYLGAHRRLPDRPLTGGWHDGRAEAGVPGEQIIRAIGPSASQRMVAALDRVIAAPPDSAPRSRSATSCRGRRHRHP
jgi:hypothetical protein